MPISKKTGAKHAHISAHPQVTADVGQNLAGKLSEKAQSAATGPSTCQQSANFPIVGMGASAGGLAAFEAFFRQMPSDTECGMAFVLVQHLAHNHASLLSELIQRYTSMHVSAIEDGMLIERNHVYIIPPDTDLSIFHGRLQLLQMSVSRGIPLPIDHFFDSLAQEKREESIAIVLSGAGSDGTHGVRAIKEAGGLVMVQTPASAEYASMPQNALATGLVDYTLPPEEMPAQLLRYVAHAINRVIPNDAGLADHGDEALQKIYLLLRTHTGHDFSDYKQNTILRRIERRMVIHQLDSLAAYARFLQQTPAEVVILFRELLIGVTRFFRDPDAFSVLNTEIIPQLLAEKNAGEAVRVWAPGCSTGEEAYSLAILLRESTGQFADTAVQIFATDIDQVAIEIARSGLYPANITADIPAEYLTRYFTQEEGNYRVNKQIRDMVVFAEQDLILDPPFSHMDLISCRNLLIYMNTDLQKRLLPLFHYALNSNGVLFLGSSETIGDFSEIFEVQNRKWKIYRRKPATTAYRLSPSLHASFPGALRTQFPSSRKMRAEEPLSLRVITEQNLLANFTPPCVLINEAEEVLYVHGSIGRYLEPAPGEANLNLLRMARPGLRLELATAVHKAFTQQDPVRIEGISLLVNDRMHTINLQVTQVTAPFAKGLFLVVFHEVADAELSIATPVAGRSTTTEQSEQIAILERTLLAKDEYLATHVEELTTANEELQSANEELQSTNEEMDTSREELQSVNEELSTVNAELQVKIEELSLANDDMNNLLAGTDVGTVFIDRDFRILRYTPAATAIVNLISTDIGRSLSHLAMNLQHYDSLLPDVQHVFATLTLKEVEVQTTDGRWYLMRILPYRTQEDIIDGVVITFVNISSLRAMQEQLKAAQLAEHAHQFAESIVETVREPLLVLDADLRVVSVNNAFLNTFQVSNEETHHRLFFELGNGQWDIAALRILLNTVLPQHTSVNDYQVTHVFDSIGLREMRVNARELRLSGDQPRMILLAIEDITERASHMASAHTPTDGELTTGDVQSTHERE